jgi:hypothetical protein
MTIYFYHELNFSVVLDIIYKLNLSIELDIIYEFDDRFVLMVDGI